MQPQIIPFIIPYCSAGEKEILAEIESFPDKEIMVMETDKNAYRETLDFTKDTNNYWKKLIRDNEKEQQVFLICRGFLEFHKTKDFDVVPVYSENNCIAFEEICIRFGFPAGDKTYL